MRDILGDLDRWQQQGEAMALATLVQVHGSAPRLPGARMLVTRSGKMAGSVSGGCVENDVVTRALEVLNEGRAVLARYGIADDSELAVGLTCAEIEVFIEPVQASAAWNAVRAALATHAPTVLAVALTPVTLAGRSLAVGVDAGATGTIDDVLDPAILGAARALLGSDETTVLELPHAGGSAAVFLEAFASPLRLVISGGSHTAVVLARMAKQIGMHVTVIDARSAYLQRERFPEADRLVHAAPGKALAELDLDGAFVVSLTHDLKFDVPALATALRSGALYVGAMGSQKTHARRCAELEDRGLGSAELARIRTPIGLDLGSRSPEEIAVAILAEMLAVRSGHDARPLRERGMAASGAGARAR
ncbi:MAG: xanthine dehydrogenase accessory factor [Deltaproteobacteria bacterium]|nr:xanthine dehydrogenase accessory factor [Deltaproteobacteria bacterium]